MRGVTPSRPSSTSIARSSTRISAFASTRRRPTSARLWEKTSRIFLWGGDAGEIYDAVETEKETAATITSSRSVSVARHVEEAGDVPGPGEDAGTRAARDLEFALIVSQKGEGTVRDAFVAIRDPRVPRIPRPPEIDVLGDDQAVPEVRGPGTIPDSVIVRIPRLRLGASMWLGFTVPIWEAIVPDGFTVKAKPAPHGTALDVHVSRAGSDAEETHVDVFASPWSSAPALWVVDDDADARDPVDADGRHRWNLADGDLGKTLRIVFDEVKPSEE